MIRVLVAKLGLDGHDRGARIISLALRRAGHEVIYTGLKQTPRAVANAAVDEDVDVIAVSMLSGAHMTLVPALLEALRELSADTPVVVGGTIAPTEAGALEARGVRAVRGVHTPLTEVLTAIEEAARANQGGAEVGAS